ncbi:MAG: FkbM family methyltransferase [Candidatus Methylarchaceae archaeon HK02M2]|nr:FkbM family methyltransferase [Candidatus Methylarchaceae archaeon HK02M2]
MTPHSGGYTFYKKHRLSTRRFITIPMNILDRLLVDVPKVDLIKVDVEGAKLEVLGGSKGVIDKIDSWIIELHTRYYD